MHLGSKVNKRYVRCSSDKLIDKVENGTAWDEDHDCLGVEKLEWGGASRRARYTNNIISSILGSDWILRFLFYT